MASFDALDAPLGVWGQFICCVPAQPRDALLDVRLGAEPAGGNAGHHCNTTQPDRALETERRELLERELHSDSARTGWTSSQVRRSASSRTGSLDNTCRVH